MQLSGGYTKGFFSSLVPSIRVTPEFVPCNPPRKKLMGNEKTLNGSLGVKKCRKWWMNSHMLCMPRGGVSPLNMHPYGSSYINTVSLRCCGRPTTTNPLRTLLGGGYFYPKGVRCAERAKQVGKPVHGCCCPTRGVVYSGFPLVPLHTLLIFSPWLGRRTVAILQHRRRW